MDKYQCYNDLLADKGKPDLLLSSADYKDLHQRELEMFVNLMHFIFLRVLLVDVLFTEKRTEVGLQILL